MGDIGVQSQVNGDHDQYDVIVIGAGLSGLYQLIQIKELGLRVKCLEAGTNVGGTWYWNRYAPISRSFPVVQC